MGEEEEEEEEEKEGKSGEEAEETRPEVEEVEGQKKEKDIVGHIFALFTSNQLNDSSSVTVDLVVANYSRGRDEAHQPKVVRGHQTTRWILAPNLARAVGPEIRLWSRTRT